MSNDATDCLGSLQSLVKLVGTDKVADLVKYLAQSHQIKVSTKLHYLEAILASGPKADGDLESVRQLKTKLLQSSRQRQLPQKRPYIQCNKTACLDTSD